MVVVVLVLLFNIYYLPLSFKLGLILQKLQWPEFKIARISTWRRSIIEFTKISADLLNFWIFIVLSHAHFHLSVVGVVEHVAVAARLPYLIPGNKPPNSCLHLNQQGQLPCCHLTSRELGVVEVVAAPAQRITVPFDRVLSATLISHAFKLL